MSKKEIASHGMVIGGFSPYHSGHHTVVEKMKEGEHNSMNIFSTQSSRRPISAEKKVDYIKTAVGKGVNVSSTQTPFHAASELHSQGKRGKLVLYGGSDRAAMADRLRDYNGKEGKHGYYKFHSIDFHQVGGERKEGAKGLAGISGSAARKSKSPTELKKFLPKELHSRAGEIFKDLKESVNPLGIFLIGGPGSGKDYLLKNIFSRFDLTEVQIEHILNGSAIELQEQGKNIVINGALSEEKIEQVKEILEDYDFDHVYVSVTNKVSQARNAARQIPLAENKRLEKWYKTDKFAKSLEESFEFKNSLDLNASSEFEKVFFANQIAKLLERIVNHGLILSETSQPKSFTVIREANSKYIRKLPRSGGITAVEKKRAESRKYIEPLLEPIGEEKEVWDKPYEKKSKPLSALQRAKAKARAARAGRNYPNLIDNMWAANEAAEPPRPNPSVETVAKKHGVTVDDLEKEIAIGVNIEREHTLDKDEARRIAIDHLEEIPDYYTRLISMEKSAKKSMKEDLDVLFERQLEGTDEYRQHAIAMTPGQKQEIDDAFDSLTKTEEKETSTVDITPTVSKKKPFNQLRATGKEFRYTMTGLPVTSRLGIAEAKKKPPMFMPDAPQLPPPPGGHPVPAGYERVKDSAGFNVLRKIREKPATVKEAVEYHLENKISFTENVFRPGSDMFFEMISEAKRLYKEGNYTPKDEWEADMLETEIGEKAIYEGQEVILDFPFEEELNEEDKTDGKGIGKPWREGGGGAVYVRDGGSIRKIRFSQSGMKKKFMDPAATRSFVARHRCLTNKDKTSASYWACRWPRFFSNSGKVWW